MVVICLKIAQQLNDFNLNSVASGAKTTEAKSLCNAMVGQYQTTEKGWKWKNSKSKLKAYPQAQLSENRKNFKKEVKKKI